MEDADRLKAAIATSVNAARRQAQKDWDAWDRTHLGPRWHLLQKELWPQQRRLVVDIAAAERDIEAAATPQNDVAPSLKALEAMGLLEGGALTLLGTAATEVNEGHSILMSKLFMSGVTKEFEPAEILAVLAAFLEGSPGSPEELNVPKKCIETLYTIDGIAKECCRAERSCGSISPDTFWDLGTQWIEPMWRWLTEEVEIATLCIEYEVFEGNFMRSLMKLANLLEEWRSMASLLEDLDTLDKLRDVEKRLLRGVAVCDSLYLRI